MSNFISISQAFANWKDGGGMGSPLEIFGDDAPALAESWNNYTDSIAKDGELCALQYHYCPAYDDKMPGEGSRWDALSDDREFILEAMGVTMSAQFVPFSASRNAKEKEPSLNWRVTLKKGEREILTTDYMQGSRHCPAYKSPPKCGSALQHRAIASECETGMVAVVEASGTVRASMKNKIDAPDLADVFHSLLLDSQVIDAGGFAEWASDMGMDSDSMKAKAMFDACMETALKMRGAFGDTTMRDLNELFEGM